MTKNDEHLFAGLFYAFVATVIEVVATLVLITGGTLWVRIPVASFVGGIGFMLAYISFRFLSGRMR